jgi:hypothetical protein
MTARTARPKTRRQDYGRNHSYLIDGQKADGVTGVLNDGVPKPALVGWSARMVAEYVVEEWQSLARLLETAGPDAVVELLKGTPNRDRDKAAKRGTEVHGYAELIALGQEVEVPDELIGHVDSYLQFRDDWQPFDEILEAVVFNRTYRYGGTLDIIATLKNRLLPSGKASRALIDIKTNRSGPFAEVALQGAAYRYAEIMVDKVSGEEVPMPEVDEVLCLWLRADGYDLIPFKAGPEEFSYFLYAQQVAHFQTVHWKTVKGEALVPPAVGVPA